MASTQSAQRQQQADATPPMSCHECQQALAQQRYILHDSHPFCIKCYESKFANKCTACSKLITTDSRDVGFRDQHWHEKCFVCKDCGSPLIDKPFAYRDDNVYCGACYEKNPTICTGCNKPFAIGMKRYLFRNQQWHENCFRCTDCQTSIGKSPFIPHDNKPYCPTCYEKRFAYKCSKCTKAINNGGVKYKGVPYHTECFTCYNCNKQLVNEKFAVKEDKQVCVDCYGVLYAKKCTRCNHPITGLGNEGSKFVSFEGRHWHTNCFSCCKCGANLVSKGFLTHLDDIVCPDCDNTVPVSTK